MFKPIATSTPKQTTKSLKTINNEKLSRLKLRAVRLESQIKTLKARFESKCKKLSDDNKSLEKELQKLIE